MLFLKIGSSNHCWHATWPPQYGRVCSNGVGLSLLIVNMDANHPIGGKVVDQCVALMHYAAQLDLQLNALLISHITTTTMLSATQ